MLSVIMLSVTNKPLMVSIVMVNVMVPVLSLPLFRILLGTPFNVSTLKYWSWVKMPESK
jgi:hypothetical protein